MYITNNYDDDDGQSRGLMCVTELRRVEEEVK